MIGLFNLDLHIRKCKSISIFKSNILKFIRPKPNDIYYCHNPKGIRLLTRLRLGLSHLCKHKFKHSFQDYLILFASAVMKLKQLRTTYFTVLPIQTKGLRQLHYNVKSIGQLSEHQMQLLIVIPWKRVF